MNSRHPLEDVLTVSEVAAIYNVSVAAVRAACKYGAVSCRKSGSTWLIYWPSAEWRWGRGEKLHRAYMRALELMFVHGVQNVAIIDDDGKLTATAATNASAYGEQVVKTFTPSDVAGFFSGTPNKHEFREVAWLMVDAD